MQRSQEMNTEATQNEMKLMNLALQSLHWVQPECRQCGRISLKAKVGLGLVVLLHSSADEMIITLVRLEPTCWDYAILNTSTKCA